MFFDGIIARKLGVSSERLRVLDSNVDQFFWLVTIGSIFYYAKDFIISEILWIGIIFTLEVSTYIVSYFKFKRTIATHSILAKFWTISLLIFFVLKLCFYLFFLKIEPQSLRPNNICDNFKNTYIENNYHQL